MQGSGVRPPHLNQSMVVQLMSEGNWRQRARNASPTGLMARTRCRLSRT